MSKNTKALLVILLLAALLIPGPVLANHNCAPDGTNPTHPDPQHECKNISGIWKGVSCHKGDPCTLCDAAIVTVNVIGFVSQIAIAIAVAMIAYGGIMMMLAAGSPDKMSAAKKTITMAIIGVTVVLASWVIVNTVIRLLTGNALFIWAQIQC